MIGLLFLRGFRPENSKMGAIHKRISPKAKQIP